MKIMKIKIWNNENNMKNNNNNCNNNEIMIMK